MSTATATLREGDLIDLIAVERFLLGDQVDLTPAEVVVAVHAGFAAGMSIRSMAIALRKSEGSIRTALREQPKVLYPPFDLSRRAA